MSSSSDSCSASPPVASPSSCSSPSSPLAAASDSFLAWEYPCSSAGEVAVGSTLASRDFFSNVSTSLKQWHGRISTSNLRHYRNQNIYIESNRSCGGMHYVVLRHAVWTHLLCSSDTSGTSTPVSCWSFVPTVRRRV